MLVTVRYHQLIVLDGVRSVTQSLIGKGDIIQYDTIFWIDR